MNMGHHGIYGKGNGTFPMNMFDTSVKVPVLISRPGAVPQGIVNDDLLSHYDVLPTLLEYLGLPNPQAQTLPGRSFAPLLRGESLLEREHVIVFDEYGPVRMIRSRDWKYIHRYPYGPHEFYDLANDPDEAHNLIDTAGAPGAHRRDERRVGRVVLPLCRSGGGWRARAGDRQGTDRLGRACRARREGLRR